MNNTEEMVSEASLSSDKLEGMDLESDSSWDLKHSPSGSTHDSDEDSLNDEIQSSADDSDEAAHVDDGDSGSCSDEEGNPDEFPKAKAQESLCIITVGNTTTEAPIVLYIVSSVSNFEVHCCLSTPLCAIADAIQMNTHVSKKYYVFYGTEKYSPDVLSQSVSALGMGDQFSLSLYFNFPVTVDGTPRWFELTSCKDMNDFFFCIKASLSSPMSLFIDGEKWLALRNPPVPLSSVFCSPDVSLSISTGCSIVVHYRGAEFPCDVCRVADTLVSRSNGVFVRLYEVVEGAVGRRWPLLVLHKGHVVKKNTMVGLEMLKKEACVDVFDLFISLLPSMAITGHSLARQFDYGDDSALRLTVSWPKSLSDKDMIQFFRQFTKVELQTDASFNVEVHGEELRLFVPGDVQSRWARLMAARNVEVFPASFVICHRKMLEEAETPERREERAPRLPASLGTRKKTPSNTTEAQEKRKEVECAKTEDVGFSALQEVKKPENKELILAPRRQRKLPEAGKRKAQTEKPASEQRRKGKVVPATAPILVPKEKPVSEQRSKERVVPKNVPILTPTKKPVSEKRSKGIVLPGTVPILTPKEQPKKGDLKLQKKWSTIVVVKADDESERKPRRGTTVTAEPNSVKRSVSEERQHSEEKSRGGPTRNGRRHKKGKMNDMN